MLAAGIARAQQTWADEDDDLTALAKKVENPLGTLYTFPFQGNTSFNSGPHRGIQEELDIQPVLPIHLNEDWNIITRTVLPVMWQPSQLPASSVPFGLGATTVSAFLSRRVPEAHLVWGVGPVVQLPTATSPSLGSSVWGLGPSVIGTYHGGPWVVGGMINNVFSLGGTPGLRGTRYNLLTVQPIINYNFKAGWFIGSIPLITADWRATGNNAWTLPLGGQVGRLIKLGGKVPVALILGAYYNVLRPAYGATWQMRTQITLIF
ncbi:MAG: hypothetical protein U1E70_20455 [Acetobacteraceae bacterium]